MKCASLRFDCWGLASTSLALGGGPGVGMPQPAASVPVIRASPMRAVSLAMDHLGRGGRLDRHARVELVEAEGQRIALLDQRVLERIAIALADPAVERVAILVFGLCVPGLAGRKVFLANVLEVRRPAEAGRTEGGGARRSEERRVGKEGRWRGAQYE